MKNALLKDKFDITGKKFIWFIIPAVVILIAAVMMIVYAFTPSVGSAVNLGMDFAGGYAMNVQIGTNLNSDNYDYYRNRINSVAENLADDQGNVYGLKIDSYQRVGSEGSDSAIYLKYKTIIDANGNAMTDSQMEEINKQFTEELENTVLRIVPYVYQNGSKFEVTYSVPMEAYRSIIENRLTDAGYSFTIRENDAHRMIGVDIESSAGMDEIIDLVSLEDDFSGKIIPATTINGAVSSDLIYSAIVAVVLALALMLIYIAIRFEITSGLSAIIALAHDMLMMFSFMFIFHIEFNSTFIAALITILGYSINNTIIIFDRVRENTSIMTGCKAGEIANRSVIETMIRSINTTLTTIFMIGMIALVCAIAGITDMVTFTLPILVGLIAGLFSSILIAPSVWAIFNRNKTFDASKKLKTRAKEKKEPETI